MRLRINSTFFFIAGIVLILLDPILAHLSNTEVIKWPANWNMDKNSHVISRILIGTGITLLVIAFLKLRTEKNQLERRKENIS